MKSADLLTYTLFIHWLDSEIRRRRQNGGNTVAPGEQENEEHPVPGQEEQHEHEADHDISR